MLCVWSTAGIKTSITAICQCLYDVLLCRIYHCGTLPMPTYFIKYLNVMYGSPLYINNFYAGVPVCQQDNINFNDILFKYCCIMIF